MTYRWLLALALAVMVGAVGTVWAAAPADATHDGPPSVLARRPAVPIRPDLVFGRSPEAWSLQQSGTWVGTVDDFEQGSEPDARRGWVLNQDRNGLAYGEYRWGVSECRASSGRRSLWAIGDGGDGRQLSCGTPYPHGVSSSLWLRLDLSTWTTSTQQLDLLFDYWLNLRNVTEGGVEADGLFVSYMLPVSGLPDPYKPIVLLNYTAAAPDSFWHEPARLDLLHAQSVYPDENGEYPEYNLAGQSEVFIEFLFQSAMAPFEVREDGVFIDNVRLEASEAGTATPTSTEPAPTTPPVTSPAPTTVTPGPTTETAVPTTVTPGSTTPAPTTPRPTTPRPTTQVPTVGPGGHLVYLPVALKNGIFDDVPLPTAPPTGQATDVPTAEPTAEPTAGPQCSDWLSNGGFEQGPTVGWVLETNAVKQDGTPLELADVILNYSVFAGQLSPPPGGGDWLAFLGNGLNVDSSLIQSEPHDTVDVTRVVSASLVFDLGLATEEEPDGTADDGFIISVLDQDGREEQIGGITEESSSVVPGRWVRLQVDDIQNFLIGGAGRETVRLRMRSIQNEDLVTQHAVDNVRLVVCESVTPVPARPAAAPRIVGHPIGRLR